MTDKQPVAFNISGETYDMKFRETKDPVYALASFCQTRSNCNTLEEDILRFIEDSFIEWFRFEGTKSLDEIMGLKKGRGAISPLYKTRSRERNLWLFKIMAILIGLGWKVPDAAKAACRELNQVITKNTPSEAKHLKPSNAGRKNDDGIPLSYKVLQSYWSRNDFEREKAERNAKITLASWTDKQKKSYQRRMKNSH